MRHSVERLHCPLTDTPLSSPDFFLGDKVWRNAHRCTDVLTHVSVLTPNETLFIRYQKSATIVSCRRCLESICDVIVLPELHLFRFVTPPRYRGEEYCDQPVCLCVCLSAREHISGSARLIFTKFCVHIPCGRASVLARQRCATLCTSGFVDDVKFGGNGRYGVAWPA